MQDAALANGDAAGKPLQEEDGKEDGSEGNADDDDHLAGDVRLWVLEISPTGLTDTPIAHTVSPRVGRRGVGVGRWFHAAPYAWYYRVFHL